MSGLTRLVDLAIESGLISICTEKDILKRAKKEKTTYYFLYWDNNWYESNTIVIQRKKFLCDSVEGMMLEGEDQYGERDNTLLAAKYAMFTTQELTV
jgi:hypothetical protein